MQQPSTGSRQPLNIHKSQPKLTSNKPQKTYYIYCHNVLTTATLTFGSPIMNAHIQIARILQRAIAPLHTNTKTTTPPQTTGIKQQHLAKEPRVIDATLTTAPTKREEPRVMTTDVQETIQDTEKIDNAPHTPNATSATASNTSPIVSPNTHPASGHTIDNVFEAAAEATSGASSKQHQTRTATFHNANSIINQHKHQQTTITPPSKDAQAP